MDKSKKLNVSALIQHLGEAGELDLVRKLREKAMKRGEFFGEEDAYIMEVDDLFPILSDYGHHDIVRKLKETMKETETDKLQLLRYRIQRMAQSIKEHCDKGDLKRAREEYEAAKDFIKISGETQESLRFLITPTALINAYSKAGKFTQAFELFREATGELAEIAKDDDGLQEVARAVSGVEDLWKLIEFGEKFVVGQEKTEERRNLLQCWILESEVVSCYSSIVFDFVRGLKESMATLRYKDDKLTLRRSSALKKAAAADMPKPEEAFQRFQNAFKTLAELYKDRELQAAAVIYREVNDVWKCCTEARKLAEKYQNRQLQKQFLKLIAGCCSESIVYYSKVGKIAEAQVAYESLKHLVATHEEQPELIPEQAKGAGNLVYAYVTAQKPDEARVAYEELQMLAEKLQGDPKLRFLRANRASEVIYAYASAQKPDEARPVYDELKQLAEDHPDEPKLLMWQATGAFDLTYGYAKANKPHEAGKIFQQLEELAKDKYVGEAMQRQKIQEMPKMQWLRQLLQKHAIS
jgi:hypothetical protein